MTVDLDSCAEWRILASCELDGELSELDFVRLEHHLDDCAACRTWLAEMRELATALRTAELEAPERNFDLTAARRWRMLRASSVAAAAAASVAAATLAILPLARPTSAPTARARAGTNLAGKRDSCPICLSRNLVLLSLTGHLDPQQAPGHGPVLS